MSSTYSTSLRIQLIDTGTEDEAWGIPTDNNLGTIIEQAITGVESVSLTNLTNYTLTSANAVADQSRNAVLVFTGILSANCNVIAPAVNKIYVISNQTTGGKNIKITMGSGANVFVANGTNQLVYCNSTGFKSAIDVNSITGNLNVTGNVTVSGNVTVNTTVGKISNPNGNLTLTSTGNTVNFSPTTGALKPPTGNTAQRPSSPVAGMSRWNSQLGWYEIWNGTVWQQITGSFNANYLIIAGGGGGGGGTNAQAGGGGGGAGGIIEGFTALAPGSSYAVTVGSGGTGGAGASTVNGLNGSNSSVFTYTALGGGGGACNSNAGFANGNSGGSGGGGYGNTAGSGSGGSGTSGQGFAGAATPGGDYGGGGGGAASAGSGYTGGTGLSSFISGSTVSYAVGGTGGIGGAGTSATGNGGNGGVSPGSRNGGAGGSGVVIISYSGLTQLATGGTVTSYTSNGTTYWVHTFTSSGTLTT